MAAKTVLLTGGLGSLGRAQARAFVSSGYNLLVLDLPEHPGASQLVEQLNREGRGTVRYVGVDLRDPERARSEVAALDQEVGGIAVLVNNAALIINRPFESFSIAEYDEQMRVNAGAAFALT